MSIDINFSQAIQDQQTLWDSLGHGAPMPGPATLLYDAVGPIGWIVVAVLIILSPTIFAVYIWPRIFPYFVPAYVKFIAFIDEFEEPGKQHPELWNPEVQARIAEEIMQGIRESRKRKKKP